MNVRRSRDRADDPGFLALPQARIYYEIKTDTYWILNDDGTIGIELPSSIRLDALNKDHITNRPNAATAPDQWTTTN